MYWPCGVPQVYAYHGSQKTIDEDFDGGTGDHTLEKDLQTTNTAAEVNDSTSNNAEARPDLPSSGIIDVRTTRSDHIFATISHDRLDIWSNRPTVVLVSLVRSRKSLDTYGTNAAVFFRPDASVVVIRTTRSYLITYSIEADPSARVLQQNLNHSQSKRQSVLRTFGTNDAAGLGEVLLRFRRAIKIDAGINAALALDRELIVATVRPAAVQCIQWDPRKGSPQASAQLLSKLDWIEHKSPIVHMTHDRAMNLSVWLTEDGTAYAVQRSRPQASRPASSEESLTSAQSSVTPPTRLFDGFCFHKPEGTDTKATLATVNARFSLVAIATTKGQILCYAAKDYAGNIPLSHTLSAPASTSSTGSLTCLTWSPDGYCLFAGYEKGWATWSVFGKEGASSFHASSSHAISNEEQWLLNIRTANWSSGGAEILLTCTNDNRIWKLEFARSAAIGCFSCANLVRALLQSPTELAIYCGHDMPDLTSISNEASLWHRTQYPRGYLHNQWPIKSCVVSQDGRYIAIAGKRGLAHYSLSSGRWKTFSDYTVENSFAIRGGMCWFNHILAAATEHANGYDLRLYSRDYELGRTPLHIETFSMPIAFIGPSGEESLLVYSYENILYHFVINVTARGAQLMQVGQIAFHGVVRAPSRVRSVSWILPDFQMRNGDPARDVEHATVLFLVDDKLVLLQPSKTPDEAIKYDMRVIAQHVEYYILMRDQIYFNFSDPIGESAPPTPSAGGLYPVRSHAHYSLRDSLWIFVGQDLRMWPDARDLLRSNNSGESTSRAPLLSVPVDFYPLSILLNKAVILGIESELLQRKDVTFAQFRTMIRTQLLLPYVLRHQLCIANDTPAAFGLSNQYQNLSYFPHALEILLHNVLDDEVDKERSKTGRKPSQLEPIPSVLSFLQMVLAPTTYLSTVVQCIRKTEVTSWRYLFAHLPPPLTLFEQALELKDLKTASGYLIVLQGMNEDEEENDEIEEDTARQQQFEDQVVRLMVLARSQGDLELCAEVARFMMGVDPRGNALRRVINKVGFNEQHQENKSDHFTADSSSTSKPVSHGQRRQQSVNQLELDIPPRTIMRKPSRLNILQVSPVEDELKSAGAESTGTGAMSRSSAGDYFSTSPGREE